MELLKSDQFFLDDQIIRDEIVNILVAGRDTVRPDICQLQVLPC